MRKYIYGPGIDEPVCMIDANGNRYYYTYDGLGSVTALWHNGTVKTVVERYSYTPFGQITVCDAAGNPKTSNVSDFGNRFMFTGREYDDETNLYYYRARMYSPTLRRFMQPDPIGYADSMNLYQYALNGPLTWIDPYGENILGGVLNFLAGRGYDDSKEVGLGDFHGRCSVDGYWNDVGQFAKGEARGMVNAGKNAVNSVLHPLDTAAGIADAVLHPVDTAKGMWKDIVSKTSVFFGDDMQAAGEIAGEALGNAAIDGIIAGATAFGGCEFFQTGCFTEGTLILTPAGQIPIEKIEAGDIVWAWDIELGQVVLGEVAQTFVRQVDCLVLVQTGNEIIETTLEHPFWVVGSGWMEAGDLKAGYLLWTSSGQYLPVEKICLWHGPFVVYNFEVADAHDYFVSDEQVLVHNTPCPLERAKQLGFPTEAKDFRPHGQPAFKGKGPGGLRYISPDVDSHNGGAWKGFDRKKSRIGTYDDNLNRIGD